MSQKFSNSRTGLEQQVEERTREIKVAQNHLIEAEKMASLGRLVAGVAHEINKPVGVARTGVSYLHEQIAETRRKYEDRSLTQEGFLSGLDSLEDLARILDENLDRAIRLIRDFQLTSADQSSHEIRKVNVRDYLSAGYSQCYSQAKKGRYRLEYRCTRRGSLPPCRSDQPGNRQSDHELCPPRFCGESRCHRHHLQGDR